MSHHCTPDQEANSADRQASMTAGGSSDRPGTHRRESTAERLHRNRDATQDESGDSSIVNSRCPTRRLSGPHELDQVSRSIGAACASTDRPYSAAARMTTASSNRLPTSCSPMGRPCSLMPQGTLTAGLPVMLKG